MQGLIRDISLREKSYTQIFSVEATVELKFCMHGAQHIF